jgi:quercetin dioxygenase-like cupin family protein
VKYWFACACSIAFAANLAAQDSSKLEIDNQWVRVLRVRQGPHAKTAMLQHPATVVVWLTDSYQRITSANGRAQEVARKAGDVTYSSAGKRAEENSSDQPLEAAVVELKQVELKPGAPKPAPVTLDPVKLDPVKLDPAHHPVVFENSSVRVLRTILEPHLKSPMHQHPHYVVVYLTELHTTMTLADGKVVDNPRRPGEVAWRDALQHVTENIGDRTAVEIQIELK